ncbi:hypothetical protein HPB50_011623 [Hyalomma asiaticum]|uniref:Uncharacterized protein n=1 Tax=Hyalomma asiaticum TaxID=266040 RepID=A0ACB7TG04_HYAAI|nr:hypothetical protein HPB50_011623 [Hyalomma asiaticum]
MQRPALIVLGSGTWAIKQSNGSQAMLAEYAANVSRLVPLLDRLANGSRVLWMLQDPVQVDRLSTSRRAISNELIDAYNQAAVHALRHSSVEVWSSIRLISEGYPGDSPDGLHTGPLAVNYLTSSARSAEHTPDAAVREEAFRRTCVHSVAMDRSFKKKRKTELAYGKRKRRTPNPRRSRVRTPSPQSVAESDATLDSQSSRDAVNNAGEVRRQCVSSSEDDGVDATVH